MVSVNGSLQVNDDGTEGEWNAAFEKVGGHLGLLVDHVDEMDYDQMLHWMVDLDAFVGKLKTELWKGVRMN